MSANELPGLDYDIDAREKFVLSMWSGGVKSGKVDLQFPPKITSDSKRANWKEQFANGYEEIATWMGAYARNVSIEFDYVVWGKFDVEKIRKSCRDIKLHLYVGGGKTMSKAPAKDKFPMITVDGWKVLYEHPQFRVLDINLKYGKEYVGSGNNWWPQHTKISLKCKLVSGWGAMFGDAPQLKEVQTDSGTLRKTVNPEWA